jgi:hypothetical protein
VLFYSIVSLGILIVTSIISYVRSKITNLIFADVIAQPQKYTVTTKMQFLAMAFLETPLILSIIISILSFDLLSYDNIFITILPAIYSGLILISAAITVYYSGYYIGHLINVATTHPQYESKIIIQLFLFLSTLQAPFIILFVVLLYIKYYIINNIQGIFFNTFLWAFLISLGSMLIIMQSMVCKAISKLIFYLKKIYLQYPGHIQQMILLLVMNMGFLQAPYIFGFIVFILLSKFFTIHIPLLYILFSFLALLFGFTGAVIIRQSGNIIHTVIKNFTYDMTKNKKVMQFAIVTQILLDSRILYILLIILLVLNFF